MEEETKARLGIKKVWGRGRDPVWLGKMRSVQI